jgi:hypothetical protein
MGRETTTKLFRKRIQEIDYPIITKSEINKKLEEEK